MNMKSSTIITFLTLCFSVLLSSYEVNAQTNKIAKNNLHSKFRKQQWEYCVVTLDSDIRSESNKFIGRTSIIYLDETNRANVNIEVRDFPTDKVTANRKALSKAFAQLGDDGWELVGSFPFLDEYGHTVSGFFFKRRKQ